MADAIWTRAECGASSHKGNAAFRRCCWRPAPPCVLAKIQALPAPLRLPSLLQTGQATLLVDHSILQFGRALRTRAAGMHGRHRTVTVTGREAGGNTSSFGRGNDAPGTGLRQIPPACHKARWISEGHSLLRATALGFLLGLGVLTGRLAHASRPNI